ncbi:DoxX family protein [Microbacterium sp. No. 7]|uniref:DoxX family protein n=1 Tax=Microbacterium sp. No. 7 TaxID=1714373 RepID=UPI001E33F3AA|nr:DoxX family protein [Microbacterium sp. No. 7]
MPFEWVVGDSSKGLHGDRAHVYDETGHRELHHVKGHYSTGSPPTVRRLLLSGLRDVPRWESLPNDLSAGAEHGSSAADVEAQMIGKLKMLIAYWIVAGLTALAFVAPAVIKLIRPKESLQERMTWVEDFSSVQVRLIGLAETLGVIGLILPMALNIAPILSPIAGVGLAIVMLGAIATHVRRKEPFAVPLVLFVLSIASAVLGFLVLL